MPKRPQILFALFLYCVHPATVTHGYVRIIAAKHYLTALCYYIAVRIYTGIDYCFFAAGANSLDLGNGVGNFKESAASLE